MEGNARRRRPPGTVPSSIITRHPVQLPLALKLQGVSLEPPAHALAVIGEKGLLSQRPARPVPALLLFSTCSLPLN